MEDMTRVIDQLAEVKRAIARLNEKKAVLESVILTAAEQDLKNT